MSRAVEAETRVLPSGEENQPGVQEGCGALTWASGGLGVGLPPGNHRGRMGPEVCPSPPSCSTEKHEAFLSAGWKRESRSLRGQIPVTITLKHRFEGRGAGPVQSGCPARLIPQQLLSKAKPPTPKPEEQRSALTWSLTATLGPSHPPCRWGRRRASCARLKSKPQDRPRVVTRSSDAQVSTLKCPFQNTSHSLLRDLGTVSGSSR